MDALTQKFEMKFAAMAASSEKQAMEQESRSVQDSLRRDREVAQTNLAKDRMQSELNALTGEVEREREQAFTSRENSRSGAVYNMQEASFLPQQRDQGPQGYGGRGGFQGYGRSSQPYSGYGQQGNSTQMYTPQTQTQDGGRFQKG